MTSYADRLKARSRAESEYGVVILSSGREVKVDLSDLEEVGKILWQDTGRYAIGPRGMYLHRFILQAPKGIEVDHINGDTYDCRRENMRLATISQNRQNRGASRNSKTGVKGVTKHGKRYRAQIMADGVLYRLGSYDTIEEAKRVYDNTAELFHGEFARR